MPAATGPEWNAPSPRRPAGAAPRLGSQLDAPGAWSTEGRCRVSDSAAREATDCPLTALTEQ